MRVALFVTCVGDTVFPEAGRATVQVLERLGPRGRVPDRADLLRPDACEQRLPRRGARARAAVRGGVRRVRSRGVAVVVVRRQRARGLSAARGRGGRRGPRAGRARARAAGARAVGAAGRAPGRDRRRRDVPASRRVSPDLPLAARDPRRRGAADAASQRARARAGAVRAGDRVLRLRRHVRDQERRHVVGDAVGQVRRARGERRGGLHRGRRVVPAADRRRARPSRLARAHDAPRRDPGGDRRTDRELPEGGEARARRRAAPRQPARRHRHDPGQAGARGRRAARLGGAARGGPSDQGGRARLARRVPRAIRVGRHRSGRAGALGLGRRGGERGRRRRRTRSRRDRGAEDEVADDGRDPPECRTRGGRRSTRSRPTSPS